MTALYSAWSSAAPIRATTAWPPVTDARTGMHSVLLRRRRQPDTARLQDGWPTHPAVNTFLSKNTVAWLPTNLLGLSWDFWLSGQTTCLRALVSQIVRLQMVSKFTSPPPLPTPPKKHVSLQSRPSPTWVVWPPAKAVIEVAHDHLHTSGLLSVRNLTGWLHATFQVGCGWCRLGGP